MTPDDVPQEWVEAGGRALYEDTWLPELWPAWEALHEKRREEYRHRFAVTLAAVIPQVKAAALREAASSLDKYAAADVNLLTSTVVLSLRSRADRIERGET